MDNKMGPDYTWELILKTDGKSVYFEMDENGHYTTRTQIITDGGHPDFAGDPAYWELVDYMYDVANGVDEG